MAAAGYTEDDYGYVDATGRYDYYGSVTPSALQGIDDFDGDLSVADREEMDTLLTIAREKAVEAFLADDALEYVTFDMYWNSDATLPKNFSWIVLGSRKPNSDRGAYIIILERGAVIG